MKLLTGLLVKYLFMSYIKNIFIGLRPKAKDLRNYFFCYSFLCYWWYLESHYHQNITTIAEKWTTLGYNLYLVETEIYKYLLIALDHNTYKKLGRSCANSTTLRELAYYLLPKHRLVENYKKKEQHIVKKSFKMTRA